MLRKSLLCGFVFGFGLFFSFDHRSTVATSHAQVQPVSQTYAIWHSMRQNERLIVDRLATDFYERSLRYAQSQAIEKQTAQLYANAQPAGRAAYRQQRRQQWQALNRYQQQAMRDAKRPLFIHLSEAQKWPFREHALVQLGAAGAITAQQSRNPGERGI